MTTNPYDINHSAANSHTCVKFLGSIPSEQLEYAEVYFWNNIQTPPSQTHLGFANHCPLEYTEDRNCLNACNNNWLKELAKYIPEAKWEINSIHNDPYLALSTEKSPGLNKVRSTLEPCKELGLDSLRVKKLASKLHVHSVNYAAKPSMSDVPFPTPLSTLIRKRFQVKPVPSRSPYIDIFLILLVEDYTVPGTKVAPFP